MGDGVVQLDALRKPARANVADLVGSEVQLAERRAAAVALQQGAQRNGGVIAQPEPCPTAHTVRRLREPRTTGRVRGRSIAAAAADRAAAAKQREPDLGAERARRPAP